MADLGDLIPLGVQIADAAGLPTNSTTIVLTITQPDGTVASPFVANPPTVTGSYVADFVPTQYGIHHVRWVSTGPAAAFTTSFDVRNYAESSIFSLAEAKQHLNMSLARTADDDELRSMVEATTAVVERHRGEVIARRTFVEDGPLGSGSKIVLLHRPVISVAAMVDANGAPILLSDYFLDKKNGILHGAGGFSRPRTVTYVAGYAQIPANYILAAKIILGHLWSTQRIQNIGTAPTLGNQSRREEATITPSGMGYAIPHRAVELLGGRPSMVV